ncbi:phage tail assembly chaperone [Pseudomonas sp. 1]|nr:phage tail assembly chaperone [Pseudomonas sp. 1]MCO7519453.1 phage tail assembly chaperone [Pseudomonas sp. 1]
MMKFSAVTGCFYDLNVHSAVPDDAIDVTHDEFQELTKGRNAGKQIVLEGGKLKLAERELSREEREVKERAWRDAQLSRVQWLRDRHRDQVEIDATPTLTPEQFNKLLVYLQALRDWPQSEHFPKIDHRPVAPPWIAEQTQ